MTTRQKTVKNESKAPEVSDPPQKIETIPLTAEEVSLLLEEGRKVRQDLEQKMKEMHRLDCSCGSKRGCVLHDRCR